MATLAELIKQREELEHQIAAMQVEARSAAIAKVRELMAEQGLTVADIIGTNAKSPAGPKKRQAVAVKYRDKAGNSWTGRGLKPKWLTAALAAGAQIEGFVV